MQIVVCNAGYMITGFFETKWEPGLVTWRMQLYEQRQLTGTLDKGFCCWCAGAWKSSLQTLSAMRRAPCPSLTTS